VSGDGMVEITTVIMRCPASEIESSYRRDE